MTNPPPVKASIIEDFVDIFLSPAAVFDRRRNGSAWIPLLVVTALVGIGFLVSAGGLEPVIDAEFQRNAARMMAENPQLTPEMLERGRGFGLLAAKVGAFITTPLSIVVVGFLVLILGKLVEARQSFSQAMMIAAYAYIPRIIAAVAIPIQLRFMSPEQLDGMARISLSPARFLDPDTTSPLVTAVLGRLDITVLWSTLLIAIGVSVVAKVSRTSGWVVALLVWLAGALPVLWPAFSGG